MAPWLSLLCVLVGIPFSSWGAGADSAPKAAAQTLLNLLRFADWPAERSRPGDDLVIGLIGSNEVAEHLLTLNDERLGSRRVRVAFVESEVDAARCHVLFTREGASWLDLEALGRGSILTVSDAEDFVERGGLVEIHMSGDRAHLQVNHELLSHTELRLSAELLDLARPGPDARGRP
jgi:hypothetical protein